MKEDYLPQILEIYNYYVKNTTVTFHKHLLNIDEMKQLVFFGNPKYKAYAILSDNEVCGYVILTQYKVREAFNRTAEVTVYLKNNFAGKGIGTKALRFIEQVAAKTDIHALVALITGENTASLNLFERNGYEKCAHIKEVGYKFERWLDLVVYQKLLS
jgi:phosphinothricin acetyltransferase